MRFLIFLLFFSNLSFAKDDYFKFSFFDPSVKGCLYEKAPYNTKLICEKVKYKRDRKAGEWGSYEWAVRTCRIILKESGQSSDYIKGCK